MIEQERERQNKLHPLSSLPNNEQNEEILLMAAFIKNNEFLTVLVEEVGEVAKALLEGNNLEEELIQVAAVCVRWLEEMKSPASSSRARKES